MELKRDARIAERLEAWGRWCLGASGSGGSRWSRMIAVMSGRRVHEEPGPVRAYVPVDHIECSLTDDAVNALPFELRQVVRAYYCKPDASHESVARSLQISPRTVLRRLCQADSRILTWLWEKKHRKNADEVTV